MKLYKLIKSDMMKAMKAKYTDKVSMLKVLISDIQRDPNKNYSDDKVIKVVKNTIKLMNENYKATKDNRLLGDIKYLEENYLPKQVTEDEVMEFLSTVDFSQLRNKMQAVGMVKKHFPAGTVDGKMVGFLISTYKVND